MDSVRTKVSPGEQHLQSLRIVADRIRRHSLICAHNAGSGHPTSAMSCAELMAALFFRILRFDIANPRNPYNDRFVLSKGHATPALWSVLAEAGAFPLDRLYDSYRRFGSDLEGHPTPRNPWIDAATGALGQGLSVGIGMALQSRLDKLDNRIFVLMGDGETAEGAIWEAIALAAHYRLGNLIGIIDVNRLGQTEATMYGHDVESYARRFGAFGWEARVVDGHNLREILDAYQAAIDYKGGPFVIIAKTLKGKGVSFLEDQNGRHGKPVTGEEYRKALQEIGEPTLAEPLSVAKPVQSSAQQSTPAAQRIAMEAPQYSREKPTPTRKAYALALTKLGKVYPQVVALDAELKNSTYSEEFLQHIPERFFECYIAEQNMVGMAHGLSVRGKIPFCSTFACFLTRAYDQIRMASISGANIKYAGSHAGVSVGEDGPSQMGLEDLAMFRAAYGSVILYPCDAVATERMVALAAQHNGTVYLRLTRPATPILYNPEDHFEIGGSEVLRSSNKDRATLIGAGITVHEALKAAAKTLEADGISVRVIDAYSIKPIDDETIRNAADQTGVIITVEDHYPEGGLGDAVLNSLSGRAVKYRKLAVKGMPRSGSPEELLEHHGISEPNIVTAVKELIA